ncbi:MAG: TolC family protein [Ferruginibacter sp.]
MQRNRMMIKKIILAVMLFTAGHVYAQDTARKINQFSLAQALDYAKQHSVQVKNALLDIEIQHQVNRDVTSIALPQVNGSGSMTDYLDIPTTLLPAGSFGPGTPAQKLKFGTKWNSSAGFNFKQMLFDGQVFIALKARNGTMELSRKVEELTEENIRANVYKIYYQLVTSKTQTQLLDANIERLEKLQHDIQIMYDNGFVEKLDIDKITVQLTNLQTEKFKVENMIANGYGGLKTLMGMPLKDSLALTDTLNDDQIKEGALEMGEAKYTDRSDYQISEITNKLNALNVRRYKLSQYPSLSFNANYSKQALRNKFDFFGKGDWFTTSYLGLQLNVPIFSGFALRARTEKARIELQQSKNQTEALKISIDNDIQTAKNNFATSIASMDYQKKNMVLAETVYNQTKKKYEIGTASTTDINNVQVDLKAAQTNYIEALYDAIIAKVDFLKATGKL